MRIRFLAAAASLASLTLASSAAQAASANDDNTSSANAALSWSTRQTIVGPTSGKLGGSSELQVQVSANLDAVADTTKPLLAVDMPKGVVVSASWSDSKNITLTVVDDGTNDAVFKAEHTIAPHVTLFLDAFGFTATYDYAASTLLASIPGNAWNYDATGSKSFAPWGWTGTPLHVNAPALTDAQLFSIPFPTIAGSKPLGGQIAINATTDPTFIYVTKQVTLSNGTPIATANGTFIVPTVDTDYLEVPAKVLGEISYSGDLLVRPAVEITSIGSFTFPFTLTLDLPDAGVSLPYSSGSTPIPVTFPATTFHIPLPNVHVLGTGVDFGSVEIGQSADKDAEIDNTGEMSAAMTFKSSDPQFVVTTSKVGAAAKGKYDLAVKFVPTAEGPQSATITVSSNDPNEPIQTIKVQGTGTKKPEPPAPPPATDTPPADTTPTDDGFKPRGDDGCGCHAAPTSSDAFGFAAVAIALGAMLRRRRRAS